MHSARVLHQNFRNLFLGFEDAFKMLDHYSSKSEYPPYNIERVSDDKYTLAKKNADYIHKGLATRNFCRAFHLNKYMEVDKADMEDGILKVHLVCNVPEEEKPKHIKIS